MPFLPTAQSWLTESTLLLEARPTTTRITTKYHIPHAPSSSHASKRQSKSKSLAKADPAAPRATLIFKTFDPASGTTLKYKTNKAAEVSRLIQILGRLARPMAGLESVGEEEVKEGIKEEEGVKKEEVVAKAPQAGAGQQAGKGKGKKKGKK